MTRIFFLLSPHLPKICYVPLKRNLSLGSCLVGCVLRCATEYFVAAVVAHTAAAANLDSPSRVLVLNKASS
jgi:hypothetical protein